MADGGFAANEPSASQPGAIAPAQACRPHAADAAKLRVFISYSRDDLDFADQLEAALKTCGFDCVLDREGISGGEDWKARLGILIAEADTVVFALSPASAASAICNWEVDESKRLGKRILPVICRSLGKARPPASLQAINYVLFYPEPKLPGSGFGEGLKRLVETLNTDFEWLREHTRYLQRATEWDQGGRPATRLLSGDDIAEAKAWVARRPKTAPAPTAVQLDFIRVSEQEAEARLSAERQRLAAMAEAQEEREKALREREAALKLAQDEQRKRANLARIRNVLLVFALILAAASIAFAWIAEEQRVEAEAQKNEADAFLKKASEIIVSAQDRFDDITQKEAFELFQAGAAHGDPDAMRKLGASFEHGLGVAKDYAKAREWYEKAAQKGDPLAMVSLGSLYAYGQGVTQDSMKADQWYKKAAETRDPRAMLEINALRGNLHGLVRETAKGREWYEKAAERGDPLGMVGLGLLYAYGQGVPRDLAKASEWFEKAAKKGNPSAAIMLSALDDVGNDGEQGYTEAARERLEKQAENGDPIVMSGLGIFYSRHQDYAKAREWLEKAADKGEQNAMVALGSLYENGSGIPQDYAKAREWYEKVVGNGNAFAMVDLGWLYANGRGVAQDYAKAREWFEKAAEQENASAMVALGALYASGLGVSKDSVKAREWIQKAVDTGDPDAKAALGRLYATGQGVAQDMATAREWFQKAADGGSAAGMTNLGTLYATGQGAPQDFAKAHEWLQKAADKGDAEAMADLGMLYAAGQGVAQDPAKALEWVQKAADRGSAAGMRSLGMLYASGQGVARDPAKAREWFEKAAKIGDAGAMILLGELYEEGHAVPQDSAKAREWYEKAADVGAPEGRDRMEALAIREAVETGSYADALRMEESRAAKTESRETERDGRPGEETARELVSVAWYALVARQFDRALTASERAHALLPSDPSIEINRAHALMFLGRAEEAKEIYLAHKGERISAPDGDLWDGVIAEDFRELGKAGLTHPMMAEIEKRLGVSP